MINDSEGPGDLSMTDLLENSDDNMTTKDIQNINTPVREGYTHRGKLGSQGCPAQCWWWLFWHQTVQPAPRPDNV